MIGAVLFVLLAAVSASFAQTGETCCEGIPPALSRIENDTIAVQETLSNFLGQTGLKRFDFSVFTTRDRRTTVRLEYKDISEATPQFGTTAGLQVVEPYFTAEHDAANPSLILMKFDLSAIFGMEGSCMESCTLAPKQSTQTSPPFVLINIRHGLMNGNILAVRMAVLPTWTYRFSAACLVKVTGSCAA